MEVLNRSGAIADDMPERGETVSNSNVLTNQAESATPWFAQLGQRLSRRVVAQVIWTGLVLWWLTSGVQIAFPAMVAVGVVTAFFFVRNPRPMTFVRIVRDWFAVAFWLLAWGLSRSAAGTLGMPIQEQIWIDMDRVLGFGQLPSHRLQRLIDWDAPPRLWEAALSTMYVSHFVVGFSLLIALYVRDRVLWGRWWRRYVLVGTLGLICFVLLPSAPPWMASDNGTVAMVYEGLPRGWDAVKIEWIHQLFEFGRDRSNTIAAMPSLHAAFPAMMYLFFAPRAGRGMRFVLGFYALFMGFVIVITGQHWLVDVFAGWLVAYAAHAFMQRAEAWNARRKAARTVSDEPVVTDVAVAVS